MPDADLQQIAAAVQSRAAELTPTEVRQPLDPKTVKAYLDANERGDGCMFASLHRRDFLYNTSPKDGEWYRWADHVWERDEFRRAQAAVEDCAIEYQGKAETIADLIEKEGVDRHDKKSPNYWMVLLEKNLRARADRLRGLNGIHKTLEFAPIVEPAMACREADFDQNPWLLPVRNGVIDLRTRQLVSGRPEDRLRRRLDIDYDPHAEYQEWVDFISEVCGNEEVAAYIKRVFGYSITGNSFEQFIWFFTGPGRNGKGVIFDLIGDIMRPYYHVISRAMLIEQKSEPSPSAASEHKYSLLGKRIIVGAETNKGQKIDGGQIKGLTGDDEIVCRQNFKSEVTFKPSHTLFVHTNNIPSGLTKEFSLIERLIKVDFPFMYVDDIAAAEKKNPAKVGFFRQKDPHLKARLRKIKPGILRWLVEGCAEWQKDGLQPPSCVLAGVQALASEEDYIGQFMADCLIAYEPSQSNDNIRISCPKLHEAFRWWWSQNMDNREKMVPGIKNVNTQIRERGHMVEKRGGITHLYRHSLNPDIEAEVDAWLKKGAKS